MKQEKELIEEILVDFYAWYCYGYQKHKKDTCVIDVVKRYMKNNRIEVKNLGNKFKKIKSK